MWMWEVQEWNVGVVVVGDSGSELGVVVAMGGFSVGVLVGKGCGY